MKVLMLLSLGLIATLAAALKFAPAAFHHVLKNETSTAFLYDSGLKRRGDPSEHSDFTLDEIASTCSAPSISHEHVYNNAVGKGRQLASAMIANSNALPNYLSKQGASPWDGELREELQTWGWAEDEAPDRCDFRDPVPDHPRSLGLGKAFASLFDVRGIQGMDPRPSTAGGRTVCHCIYHYNSPAVVNKPDYGQAWPPRNQQQYEVNGRLYMITGALYTIAVNHAVGFIAFIDRRSPQHAANDIWGRRPSRDELPALRHTSDVAWGLWNRRQGPENPALGKIKYFLVGPITNTETEKVIFEIFGEDQAPRWPGREFSMLEQQAQAVLGSPNGLAVALFLAQHKRQMRGKYFVSGVTLFNSDGVPSRPYALFAVQRSATEDQT